MNEILNIIKELATSNTINFIIMVGLLWFIIKKVHIGTALKNSIDTIKKQISNSEEEKIRSNKLLHKNEDLMKKLPNDLEELEKTSKNKLTAFEEDIKKNTAKSIENLASSIERIKTIEEKKVSNTLTSETSREAIDLAKQEIRQLLENNPELHNDFIQQSLDELDKVKI